MKKAIICLFIFCSFFATLSAKEKKTNKNKEKASALSLLQVEDDPADKELFSILKKRRVMLNWHNYTAWVTVGLMAGALVSAPDEKSSSAHKWIGIASGVGYLTSASLAYFAPRPENTKQSKNISIHKHLTWIHAPAMILAAYTGMKAHKRRKDGKKLDSFSDMHGAFAAIASVSFGLAAVSSMDWTLNLFPTPNKEIACVISKSF